MYWLILTILLRHSEADLIPEQSNLKPLATCLNNLIETIPENKIIVTVDLNLQIERPVIQYDPTKNFIWFKVERSNIIIMGTRTHHLQPTLAKLTQEPIFNPRSSIIIITPKIDTAIYKATSKFHLNNVKVIEEDPKTQNIYSYRPYKTQNVNEPKTDFFQWGTCNGAQNWNLSTPQIPKKWSNTTLQALNNIVPPYTICPRCLKDKGIEIEAFDIVANYLNLRVVYTKDTFDYWGSKENGTYSSLLGELQRREGDMAIGVFHSKFDEHLDFDMTYTYMEDSTRWLVPKAKILPYWRRLSLIFTKEVYLTLLASIVLMVVICHFLYNTSYFSSWMVLFQILIEVSVFKLPMSFRTILMIWIGSCLVLSTIFKSKLIDIMSRNSYEHQISSLKDIVESKLDILTDHDIAKFYHDPNDYAEIYIKNNYKYCADPRWCINRTAFHQDCVTIDFERTNRFFLPHFVKPDGDIPFYLFKTPIFPVHIHLFFVKGYPIFLQVDQLLMRLKSGGIIQHLYNNAGYNAKLALMRKTIFKAEVLSLEQMEVAFFMWGLGILGSVLCFVGEVAMEVGKIQNT